jgi:hypothetical protein
MEKDQLTYWKTSKNRSTFNHAFHVEQKRDANTNAIRDLSMLLSGAFSSRKRRLWEAGVVDALVCEFKRFPLLLRWRLCGVVGGRLC